MCQIELAITVTGSPSGFYAPAAALSPFRRGVEKKADDSKSLPKHEVGGGGGVLSLGEF